MRLFTLFLSLLFAFVLAQDTTVDETSTVTFYTTCTVQQVHTTYMTMSEETTTMVISAKVYPTAASVASAVSAGPVGAYATGLSNNGTVSSATQPGSTYYASATPYSQTTNGGLKTTGAQNLFAAAACLTLTILAAW